MKGEPVTHSVTPLVHSIILENYVQHLAMEIQQAELVTPDPRERDFLPQGRPGPFVAFVRAGTRNDEFYGFRVFLLVRILC